MIDIAGPVQTLSYVYTDQMILNSSQNQALHINYLCSFLSYTSKPSNAYKVSSKIKGGRWEKRLWT